MLKTIKNATLTGLALCLLMLTGQTHAITLNFSCIVNETDPTEQYTEDCMFAEDQLSVEVELIDNLTDPDQVLITILNTGDEQLTVTEVYIADSTGLFTTPIVPEEDLTYSGDGVVFETPATPGELPGADVVGFESTIGLTADALKQPQDGIDPDEWLGITLDLAQDVTLDDVIAALVSGDLLLGVHVTNFLDGGSESLVTNPVPVPAAVWLFGSALLGLVGVARRKIA
jgi:hypothetical protein